MAGFRASLAFAALCASLCGATGVAGRGPFSTAGSKVFDSAGNWVTFRGIGLSCTEYMARPIFPPEYGYDACFGGLPAANATTGPILNSEVNNVMKYLLPDVAGGRFVTQPAVTKVPWPAPYNEVLSPGAPRVIPIVRIPVTSGSYMFDAEANALNASGYRHIIDLLVQNFTAQGVAVIIDQHGDCADGGKLNCSHRDGPMALRDWGAEANGTLRFWDQVSQAYAANPMVMYELYNEPHVWYQALYGGDPLYAGHAEMLRVVRTNAPQGLAVIGGTGWAQDAAGLLALAEQYTSQYGAPPTNVLWNLHPYQGMFQGVWISMRSTMRLTLALQTMGPVIWTELGQYCCNANNITGCQGPQRCNDHPHGDWFVHNVINMAAQLDVSWTGWAWRGTNANGGNCSAPAGQAECAYPDMRDVGGVLTTAASGGADWAEVWATYVAAPTIVVQDAGNRSAINVTDAEVKGFLPRPCIVPAMGMGGACGWPLGFNVSQLPWVSMWNQSVGESVLPGLPPSGPPASCVQQACPGYTCDTTSPIVPMPQPCGA